MSNEDLLRMLLEARVALDDLEAIVKDMLRRPSKRELGPVLHYRNAREAYKKLRNIIDHLIGIARGTAPPEGESGPTAH